MDWFDKFVGNAWDSATGVYEKYLDFESKKYELDNLKNIAFIDSAKAAEGVPKTYLPNALGGVKIEYVAFGLLAVVALFVLKK